MSYDLQLLRDAAPAAINAIREHAIYRDALTSDRKIQKARNIADLLERGHRSRPNSKSAMLVDIVA